eukprot:UN29489
MSNEDETSTSTSTSDNKKTKTKEPPLILKLGESFVDPFMEFATRFREIFIEQNKFPTSRKESENALAQFTRNTFNKYFTLVKATSPDKLTRDEEYLNQFYSTLNKPDKLIPQAGIRDRAAEIIELSIRSSISATYATCYIKIRQYYKDFLNELVLNKMQMKIVKKRISILMHGIDSCIGDAMVVVQKVQELGKILSKWSLDVNFIDYIVEELKELLHGLYIILIDSDNLIYVSSGIIYTPNSQTLRYVKPLCSEIEYEPFHLLLLSKVCYATAEQVVPSVVKTFNSLFKKTYRNTNIYGQSKIHEHELLNIAKYCEDCSKSLRTLFTERIVSNVVASLDESEGSMGKIDDGLRPNIRTMTQVFDNTLSILRCLYDIPEQIQCHEPVESTMY